MRWTILLIAILVLGGGVALTRPGPAPGRVLYLRLRLSPYAGATKEIQLWIDGANGRLRYAEAMPQSGSGLANGAATTRLPWYSITLRRQAGGTCAVAATTLLDGSERADPFQCAGLLALKDVRSLWRRAALLRQRYGSHATVTAQTVRIPVPARTDLVTPVMDRYNMKYGYETMVPGVLVVDRVTGRPLSISGYRRDGATMTEMIVEARDLLPGALPDDFFDAPRFSLPDRVPTLYRWLHAVLPWHP